MGEVRVLVLGPAVVGAGDDTLPVRRPLERGLLVRLALARGAAVPDDRLAADLWDDEDDSRIGRLRVVVSRLRRTLGPAAAAVERTGGGYRLAGDVPDLREAEAAAGRMHAALRAGDHAAARDAAAAALRAWRGPALTDLRSLPFARAEGERLDARHRELTVHRLSAELALGAGAEVVAELGGLAAADPLHEPLRGMLAIALYRAGRQADALAELAALRRALADGLGVDPTAETADLELRLLRQDPGLRPPVSGREAPSAPATATPADRPASREPTDIRPALARGIVGRRAELVMLAGRLDAALAGEPCVVLVEGGPGAGRTRLLEALGHLAEQHGTEVWWGRATGGAPAFWPWRQALRRWRDGPHAVPPAAPLARIVPELAGAAPAADGPEPRPSDPDDRFGLFEHVVAFLQDAAPADGPGDGLVVLLDDLHLADLASLLLLAHLARCLSAARLLVAAGLRPGELSDEQARARADLVRQPATTSVEPAGLGEAAVAELLTPVLGRECTPEVAAEVARRTGGNPLFVREIGRVMAEGGGGLPTAVRDAVRHQLDAVEDRVRGVLAAAAVLGGEIEADVVAAVLDRAPTDVLDDLDAGVASGLLLRDPGTGGGTVGGTVFANDVVREAVGLGVGSGERARMHLRAAEHLGSAGPGSRVHRIAHHRLEALPLGDRELAVRATGAAADLALRRFAFEDAVALYDHALAAGSAADLSGRAELLLDKAHAQYLSHDVDGAMRSCEEAAGLAGHLGDVALLGRAACELADVGDAAWLATTRRWCRTALAGLPDTDAPLRARLMARLAVAATWDDDGVTADSAPGGTGAAALAMADRIGDADARYAALRARQLALSGPDGTSERLGLGDRMLGLVPDLGDPAALWGRLWRFDALVQLGRTDEAETELDMLDPVVARMRQPLPRWHLVRSRAALLAGRGRFPEAMEAAREAVGAAQRGRHRAAEYPMHAFRLSVAELTGDPIDESVFEIEREQPPPRILSMFAARWHATHGDVAEARRIHARLPRTETTALRPFMQVLFHAVAGTLAAAVGDDEAADHSYAALLPHAGLHVAAGAGVTMTEGSVELVLGTVAAARGRTDAAVGHLRAAVAANTASGLDPFATRARTRLAGQLRCRAHPGDAAEADALDAGAAATAARIGMPLR